jgi:hypothetical protein
MKQRHNPNKYRYLFPMAAAGLLGTISLAGCSSEQPTPPETSSASAAPVPTCDVNATEVTGRTVTLGVEAANEFRPGVYNVEKTTFDYGDGTSGDSKRHTYAAAGVYTLHASLVMDVAPGPDVNAPFKDGFEVLCEPHVVGIIN